jgi:hypothetical protein
MSFERLSEPGQRAKYLKIVNYWPKSRLSSRGLRDGSIRASTERSLSRCMDARASRVSTQKSEFHRKSESLGDKRALDEQHAKLAVFKKHCIGRVAGNHDKKLKSLAGLNSPPVVHAQTSHYAEPEESYTQPWLAQPLSVRNAPSQTSTRPQALQQPWAILQSRLKFRQPRHSNHRDVVETKNEIAPVQRQRKQTHAAAGAGCADTSDKTVQTDLAERQALQVSIHHSGQAVRQAALDKTRWPKQITLNSGRGRVARGPGGKDEPDRRRRTGYPGDCRCSFRCPESLPGEQCRQACGICHSPIEIQQGEGRGTKTYV